MSAPKKLLPDDEPDDIAARHEAIALYGLLLERNTHNEMVDAMRVAKVLTYALAVHLASCDSADGSHREEIIFEGVSVKLREIYREFRKYCVNGEFTWH